MTRIRHHIADRAGLGFETVEQGRDIARCLERADRKGTFLLDSVTALLLNELYPDPTTWKLDADAPDRCQKGLETLCNQVQNIVLVSDYIYSDAAKYDEETEVYRRALPGWTGFWRGLRMRSSRSAPGAISSTKEKESYEVFFSRLFYVPVHVLQPS